MMNVYNSRMLPEVVEMKKNMNATEVGVIQH